MTLALALATAQAQAEAWSPLMDGGWLDLFKGTRPAAPEDDPGSPPLCSLGLPAPFAASIVDGTITASAILPEPTLRAGDVAWFRIWRADHVTPVVDGSVSLDAGGGDLQLGSLVLFLGAVVSLTSLVLSVPGS